MDQFIWSFVLLVVPNGGDAEVLMTIDDLTYTECMYTMGYTMGGVYDPEKHEVMDELGFDDRGDVLLTIKETSSGDVAQVTCMGFERETDVIDWSKS
jgi:hypothetical protein